MDLGFGGVSEFCQFTKLTIYIYFKINKMFYYLQSVSKHVIPLNPSLHTHTPLGRQLPSFLHEK